MEGASSYDQLHDQVMILAAPMTIPSQNNSSYNDDIKEFVFGNPSVGSSFPHCYLSEALAPYYRNVASPDPASSNTGVVDAKSDLSFSTGIDIAQSSANHSPSYRRTKAEDGSSNSRLTSAESMDSNVRRRKKQKREEAKKQKEERKAKLEAHLEAEGYIQVRARRGQATDSHSLAERVRRKKLSERMTILESLVPGCDQVTGKAQVLDVIINYVQSLQNQIEFLSMRLASEDQCILSEYSFDDQDHLKETQEIGGMTYDQQVPYGGFEQQNLHNIIEPLELDNTTAFSQEVGSAILGQFSEPKKQGLLDQIGLDWITSFDF